MLLKEREEQVVEHLDRGSRDLERLAGAQSDEREQVEEEHDEQVEDEHDDRGPRGLQRPAAAQDDEETETDYGKHPRSASGAEPT
jgi:hypothetical protein